MSDSSASITIVGAGVLGLSVAACLSARGQATTVVDPGDANASSVAAGMIAPAAEALSDWRDSEGSVDRSDLYRHARDLWPDVAGRLGITLSREGVEWRGGDVEAVREVWRWMGFHPSGGAHPFTAADWRVDPGQALARMAATPSVTMHPGRAKALHRENGRWRLDLEGGEPLWSEIVVLAHGVGGIATGGSAGRLIEKITPIRGQLAFAPGSTPDRVIKTPAGYVAPAPGGTVYGPSMERGRTGLTPDPVAGEAMLAALAAAAEVQAPRAVEWRVGVRGATPDGLPMAGPSGEPGLFLAMAPRRNGWLMGPLVGKIVAEAIEGGDMDAHAAALDPRRFL